MSLFEYAYFTPYKKLKLKQIIEGFKNEKITISHCPT